MELIRGLDNLRVLKEGKMDWVYKKLELVGVSDKSFEDAIRNAIEKATKTVHGLAWFEVTEQHGKIMDGKVTEFQAVVKVAFKVD